MDSQRAQQEKFTAVPSPTIRIEFTARLLRVLQPLAILNGHKEAATWILPGNFGKNIYPVYHCQEVQIANLSAPNTLDNEPHGA
jgi:hypothetical protein